MNLSFLFCYFLASVLENFYPSGTLGAHTLNKDRVKDRVIYTFFLLLWSRIAFLVSRIAFLVAVTWKAQQFHRTKGNIDIPAMLDALVLSLVEVGVPFFRKLVNSQESSSVDERQWLPFQTYEMSNSDDEQDSERNSEEAKKVRTSSENNSYDVCSSASDADTKTNVAEVKRWTLKDFKIGKSLGQGTFGEVFLALERRTKRIVAIKVVSVSQPVKDELLKLVRREIENQARLRHPHIVRTYGYFHHKNNVYLVLEYCRGGDLYGKLIRMGSFTEETSARYISDLANALMQCHSKNIIHRDIKLDNILLGSMDDVKIADFGSSVNTLNRRRNTFCGTVAYMAPEMVAQREYDEQVDVWALGVLLYEFLVGSHPFSAPTSEETFRRISNRDIRWPKGMPEDAKDLISKLLKTDPQERLSLEKIPNHPFVLRNLRG